MASPIKNGQVQWAEVERWVKLALIMAAVLGGYWLLRVEMAEVKTTQARMERQMVILEAKVDAFDKALVSSQRENAQCIADLTSTMIRIETHVEYLRKAVEDDRR